MERRYRIQGSADITIVVRLALHALDFRIVKFPYNDKIVCIRCSCSIYFWAYFLSVKDQPLLEGVGYSVEGATLEELWELPLLSSPIKCLATWATFSSGTPFRTWATVSATTSGAPDAISLNSDSSAAYFSGGTKPVVAGGWPAFVAVAVAAVGDGWTSVR